MRSSTLLFHARRAAADAAVVTTLSGLLAQSVLFGPTPVSSAIARIRELMRDGGEDRVLGAYLNQNLAGLLAMEGAFGEARRVHREALAVFEEVGLLTRRITVVGSSIELLAGDPAAAENDLREMLELLAGVDAQGFTATYEALLADVLCTLGRREEAETLARKAGAESPDDDVGTQVVWRTALGRVLRSTARSRPRADCSVKRGASPTASIFRTYAWPRSRPPPKSRGRKAGRPTRGPCSRRRATSWPRRATS